MVVLDTDLLTLCFRDQGTAGVTLQRRLRLSGETEFWTTIVTYEEQCRGWLAYLSKSRTTEELVTAYRKFSSHLKEFQSIPILDFDQPAATIYQELKSSKIRVGTMDLRIAAIAIAHEATLLFRNLSDFRKIERLKVEDWSA